MFNGKGIFLYTDGCTYEGDFLNDEKHGYGIYKYITGEYYDG
jgi:hypothetical protein